MIHPEIPNRENYMEFVEAFWLDLKNIGRNLTLYSGTVILGVMLYMPLLRTYNNMENDKYNLQGVYALVRKNDAEKIYSINSE